MGMMTEMWPGEETTEIRCHLCHQAVALFPGPPQAITPALLVDLVQAGQWHQPYCPGVPPSVGVGG